MPLTRPTRTVLCGLAAIGVSATMIGCGPGEAVEARPNVAADAGRKVVAPPTTEPSEARPTPKADAVPAAEEPGPTPKAATEPTPATEEAEKPSVTLASAERTDAVPSATPAPATDPSQFPGGIVPASPNAQPLPGGPRLLVPERVFRADGRPRALRVNYDDLDLLRVLNMGDPLPENVVEQFPSWLRELEGKTIRLRGFMYPA